MNKIYNKKIYIIILNYKSPNDTINCINSINKQNYSNYQIIIVDNNSKDDSIPQIEVYLNKNKSLNDKTIIIKNCKNLGYGHGNNIGIKYALNKKDCDFLWILNNDIIINKSSIKELLINANNNTIYGSKILKYNNQSIIDSLGGKLNYIFLTTSHNFSNFKNSNIYKKNIRIDYVHGASMFFHKNIIKNNGYFIEDYFMYYEDVEFCLRAKKNNIKIIINQNCILFNNDNYAKYKKKIRQLMKVYSIINRLKIGKRYFKNKIFFVYIGILFSTLKCFCKFRFKETYLIINYIIKNKI